MWYREYLMSIINNIEGMQIRQEACFKEEGMIWNTSRSWRELYSGARISAEVRLHRLSTAEKQTNALTPR
jgi:hypothetical protein